jgi:hypothetical protein
MSWALIVILAVPLVSVLISVLAGWRTARAATLVAGLVSFGLAIGRFVYQPLTRLALAGAELARRLQSGQLSSYLLYMLMALILALALIPVLR